jgi:alpha-mannosidase
MLLIPMHHVGAELSEGKSDPNKGDTLWLIPHTHWEGAVFKTREEYLQMGLPHILTALRLLETYPDYRFVLDQVCYVKPFLERYPEEETTFRKMAAEGRLQIVGGTDVMADENMPGGESFVRQILYGKGYYRRTLGVDVTVSWQLDSFGHHGQMPQLLQSAGYKSFWFFRGVPNAEVPMEFIWEGIDGSQIPAFRTPTPAGYVMFYGIPQTLPEFNEFAQRQFESLTPFVRGSDRVALVGPDVAEPEISLPVLVDKFNQQKYIPFKIRFGVPTDFEDITVRRNDRPIIRGELNPIFQGTYSSRIELKQRMRDLERLLTTAEKFSVLSGLMGETVINQMLWEAWEPLLFNQAHDLMSGVMTDHVYEDTIRGYNFSTCLAEKFVDSGFQSIVSKIDTTGEGIPLVVYNTLSWPRSDTAEVDVGFSQSGICNLQIIDSAGNAIPAQILNKTCYENGNLKTARILFVAQDVPALGFSTYHVLPLILPCEFPAKTSEEIEGNSIENEFYRVTFDRRNGAMTSLIVKSNQWEVIRGPANIISCQPDAGDLWELYRTLDGSSRIAMKNQQPVPQPENAKLSSRFTPESSSLKVGPVFSQYQASYRFGEKGILATTVRLYSGLRRIDIHTEIINNEKHVRYQMLFPSSIEGGECVHEIPFGAIQRPEGIEFPSQNWIDYHNNERGLALINRGLPGNLVSDDTLMLSLMRSTSILGYGSIGGYEQGVSSESGYDLGKRFHFDYALVPHNSPWQEAVVWQHGLEFNQPLLVCKTTPHKGVLPNQWGLVEISHPNVVLSAVKPGEEEGTSIFRVYEATGQSADNVTITFRTEVSAACETNLIEDPVQKIELTNNRLEFNLKPFQIKTFKLKLASL